MVTGWVPAGYPQEDVRPLVERVEHRIRPGDGLLVLAHAGYAYGLYTQEQIDIRPTELAATGFTVEALHPDVVVLPPTPGDNEGLDHPIDELVGSRRRVWLLASHLTAPIAERLAHTRSRLMAHGFERQRLWRVPGARLLLWSRPDGRGRLVPKSRTSPAMPAPSANNSGWAPTTSHPPSRPETTGASRPVSLSDFSS